MVMQHLREAEREISLQVLITERCLCLMKAAVCEREVGPLPPFSSSLFRSPPYFIYPQPRLFFLLPEFQVLNSSSPFFFRLNIAVYHLRFLSFIRSSPLICHHPSLFYLSSHICLHQTLTAYITQFQT